MCLIQQEKLIILVYKHQWWHEKSVLINQVTKEIQKYLYHKFKVFQSCLCNSSRLINLDILQISQCWISNKRWETQAIKIEKTLVHYIKTYSKQLDSHNLKVKKKLLPEKEETLISLYLQITVIFHNNSRVL